MRPSLIPTSVMMKEGSLRLFPGANCAVSSTVVMYPLHSGMGVLLVGDGAGVGLAVVMVGEGVGSGVWGVGRQAASRIPATKHVDAMERTNGGILPMAYRLPITVLP